MRSSTCALILLVLLNRCWREGSSGGGVGGGRKGRKGTLTFCNLQSTCTSCTPHFYFPSEDTGVPSPTETFLGACLLTAMWALSLLKIAAQHRGHQPPRAHCKGRNRSGGNQRFRIILQVIVPSQGALPWTLHPTGKGSPQQPPSRLSSCLAH